MFPILSEVMHAAKHVTYARPLRKKIYASNISEYWTWSRTYVLCKMKRVWQMFYLWPRSRGPSIFVGTYDFVLMLIAATYRRNVGPMYATNRPVLQAHWMILHNAIARVSVNLGHLVGWVHVLTSNISYFHQFHSLIPHSDGRIPVFQDIISSKRLPPLRRSADQRSTSKQVHIKSAIASAYKLHVQYRPTPRHIHTVYFSMDVSRCVSKKSETYRGAYIRELWVGLL